MVIQELRQEHSLTMLLQIAQIPRATFYYHAKRMEQKDKYATVKAKITALFHEHQGRYGYRRITAELHNQNFPINHKTVQRLMRELGLVCRVRMKKYRSYKGEVGKGQTICWIVISTQRSRTRNGQRRSHSSGCLVRSCTYPQSWICAAAIS